MAAYSKLVRLSCYEVGHTWTPYCGTAILEVGFHGLKESFKIYAPLYVVAALLRKKDKEYFKKKLLPEILQSTLFLGTNAFAFIGSFCFWRLVTGMYCFFNVFICGIPSFALAMLIERKDRNLLGKYNFCTSAFVPALSACYIAINLERKGRRGLLAVYIANLATETLYRMAVFRGYVRPVWNGEVILFSLATAVFMYLYRLRNGLRDSVRSGINFIVGPSEAGSLRTVADELPDTTGYTAGPPSPPSRRSSPGSWLTLVDYLVNLHPDLRKQANAWRKGPKHRLCRHPHSCLATTIEAGVRMYVLGYAIQAAVKLFGSLSQVWRWPRAVLDALRHPDNASLGKFLGVYSAVFQAVNCLLRWCRDKDEALHGLLAGFLAGWSMVFYKSSSIAMYLVSKLAEVLWFKGVEAGHLPLIKCADIIIYTISTSIVFHAAVFEPHNLRPAYWKFLTKLTNKRFGQMNRRLLDMYGTQASSAFPGFWPKYDPRFTKLPLVSPATIDL